MTRFRFAALFLASAAVPCLPLTSNDSAMAKNNKSFEDRLAVQSALGDGEYWLIKGAPAKAVAALEAELARIDGNRRYLLLLRDAYKAYVAKLQHEKQNDLAGKYLRRLHILDPDAAKLLMRPSAQVANAEPQPNRKAAPAPKPQPPQPKFRGNIDNNTPSDPFSIKNALDKKAMAAESQRIWKYRQAAEQKFRERKYEEARQLYRYVYRVKPSAIQGCTDRWAYCKLKYVDAMVASGRTDSSTRLALMKETRTAIQMSPRLRQAGEGLLKQLTPQRAPAAPSQQTQVVHGGKAGVWNVAETRHFRILHRSDRMTAERLAQSAESTRSAVIAKWFGAAFQPWKSKCDVYLFPTAQEYSKKTGVSSRSSGHSRIEKDGKSGRVVSLRIYLHRDAAALLKSVLPHETTHAVFAGQFGRHHVPRWVDEGAAILSEPEEQIQRHRRRTQDFVSQGQAFALKELMKLDDYPSASRLYPFYAQSVSVVEYLSKQRGPRVFTQFVRDALRSGYAGALQKHYNVASYTELETRWRTHAAARTEGHVSARGSTGR